MIKELCLYNPNQSNYQISAKTYTKSHKEDQISNININKSSSYINSKNPNISN